MILDLRQVQALHYMSTYLQLCSANFYTFSTVSTGAVIIGFLAGGVCYLAVAWKNHLHLDDALDVWGVHGIGGVLGCICTGIFATKLWNPGGADGLLLGGVYFFLMQTVSVLITAVYAFGFSYAALWLINKVMPVKVTKEDEENGLDASIHGDTAYEMI